jgi:hypothetical protein
MSTFEFRDAPEGTLVRILFTWGKTRREREEATETRAFLADVVERGQVALTKVLTAEMAHRAALADGVPPEPVAPASMDRELREPILG